MKICSKRQCLCPTYSFIPQILSSTTSLALSENKEMTGWVNKVSALTSSRIFHSVFEPDPCLCAPVWSDQSRGTSYLLPSQISAGTHFWLRIKAIITIVSRPGWVTPREQNSLVIREQHALSMKMCTRAGIASLGDF